MEVQSNWPLIKSFLDHFYNKILQEIIRNNNRSVNIGNDIEYFFVLTDKPNSIISHGDVY